MTSKQTRQQHASTTIVTAGNDVKQPTAKQLHQLDCNNGNGDIFYVVVAGELS
jgi:hypothetical protein